MRERLRDRHCPSCIRKGHRNTTADAPFSAMSFSICGFHFVAALQHGRDLVFVEPGAQPGIEILAGQRQHPVPEVSFDPAQRRRDIRGKPEGAGVVDQNRAPGLITQQVPQVPVPVADERVEHRHPRQLLVPRGPVRVAWWCIALPHVDDVLNPQRGRTRAALHLPFYCGWNHVEFQKPVELVRGDLSLVTRKKTRDKPPEARPSTPSAPPAHPAEEHSAW